MQRNKRILFFPFDLLSHYSRSIMLANSIKEQYEVQILYSEKYRYLYETFKISSFRCLSFDSELILEYSKRFSFDWISEDYLENIFLDQVRAIKALKPDLIIGDAVWTMGMAAEYCKTPYCSVLNAYMSCHYNEVRGLPLNHPAHKFKEKLPKSVFDFLTKTGEELAFRKYHAPFKKIRRKWGLRSKRKLLNELEGDLTLICDDRNLFPLKKLPLGFHSIGPLYFESNITGEILPEIKQGKTILVCMGSSGEFHKLQVLKDPLFNEYLFIVISDKEEMHLGENFMVKKFLNLDKVLPLIDLLICHGGNGTIYHSLKHKVPVLALPSHFEQEWNMQRVVKFKLGEIIKETSSAAHIKSKIEFWIKQRNCIAHSFKIDLNASLVQFGDIIIPKMYSN